MANSAILDSWGDPARTALVNGAERFSTNRPSMPVRVEGIERAVPITDWQVMLSVSRRLFANNGIIQGALTQKAMHAVGCAWQPVFQGADKEWGKAATVWLEEEWFPVCNVRGETYDFRTSLFLSSIDIDRDGDEAELLTETEDGFPQIQTIGAHRIGQRSSAEKKVSPEALSDIPGPDGKMRTMKGVYAGLSISMGCIVNALNRTVAYRILGETPSDDRDVSARDLVFNFDPLYPDQLRGFPIFSHALNDWRDADQSQYWEQLAQLIASSIGLIEHNERGGVDESNPNYIGSEAGANRSMSSETLAGGMFRYFKAGTNSKLEAFMNPRPGDAWDSFQDRIARKALGPVWPYSFAWKADGMNGTQERSCIETARQFIQDRQELLKPRAKRKVGYAISKAIKLGILPEYKGADKGGFLKWGFTMPAEFNIDHGREDQQQRENYKIAFVNLAEYLHKTGAQKTVREHWLERAHEQADKLDAVAEVEKLRGVTIDPREMQMFNPNEPAIVEEPPAPPVKK